MRSAFLSVDIDLCRFKPLFAFGDEVVNTLGADAAIFEVVQSFLDVRFKLAVFQTLQGLIVLHRGNDQGGAPVPCYCYRFPQSGIADKTPFIFSFGRSKFLHMIHSSYLSQFGLK